MAAMNRQCPYRHLSYASFRLHAYCRIFLSAVDAPNSRIYRRTFSFCETRPNRSPHSTDPPEPSAESANSSLHAQASDSLPLDRTFTSDPQSHNDHAERSRPAQPETFSEASTEAPETENRLSENLIRSPVQIRRARGAARRETRAPPPSSTQNDLKHNPWAAILASPPRSCALTGARSPRELLIDFGLVRHPESSSLWVMPTQLLEGDLQGLENPKPSSSVGHEENESVLRKAPPLTRVTGASSVFGLPDLKKPSIIPRLFRHHLKHPVGPLSKNHLQNMVWRQDMTDFVLQMLRRYATNWLKKSSVNDGRTVTPRAWKVLDTCRNPTVQQLEDGLKRLGDLENMSWGAILVLDPKSEQLGEMTESAGAAAVPGESTASGIEEVRDTHSNLHSGQQGEIAESADTTAVPDENASSDIGAFQGTHSAETSEPSLPDFAQLPDHASKVPIFDLRGLLSEANLDELRSCHPLFQQNALFFRPFKNITEKPLVALWKVKLYMTDDEQFPS